MKTALQTISNKIGKVPVVLLPLEDYEKMREDLEMLRSKTLPISIKRARKELKEGKVFTLLEVKKLLKLS